MRLLVIGHTAHYLRGEQIVGWGPTVREVDQLGRAFDHVTHLACLHPGPAPESALPYQAPNLETLLVPPAGGTRGGDKLRFLSLGPHYIRTILRALRNADVIQVRTPGSLGLYGLLLVSLAAKQPRWVKYAGNWAEKGLAPPSFAFTRWWLRNGWSRGPVTINGRWPGDPAFIYPFLNPSFSLDELRQARRASDAKTLSSPLALLFVGRLEASKGPAFALQVFQIVRERTPARMKFIGDGPQRRELEQISREMGLSGEVTFHGWLPHDQVLQSMARAHFLLLPSATEGWPKVLSEAMAYGVPSLANHVSAIPQILQETQAGLALPVEQAGKYAQAILETVENPERWHALSRAGLRAAPRFTYENYLSSLDEMFVSFYGQSPLNQALVQASRLALAQAMEP